MKKALSIILIFALIFSSECFVFGEAGQGLSDEVKSLARIGMLEGDGFGITIDYSQKEMDRITAAISILKLRGLYDEAVKYKGRSNFSDADQVKWDEGRNILAYVKAKGIFAGNEKGEFVPYGKISEASYYKVLLETLGYKQVMGKASGDFTWEKTLEFAKQIGLKPSGAVRFTINDLAKATIGALKMNNKSGKIYIALLVEGKKIDKQKAVDAGLYEEPAAKIKSVKVLGNSVLEAAFYSNNTRKVAEDINRYSIEGIQINSVVYIDGKTVRIKTNAQKTGQYYYISFEGSSVKYRAAARVYDAPVVKTIVSNENEKIVIEFDKELDYPTATDTASYIISGVDIIKAELSGKRVTLETSGLAANKSYTLRLVDIRSVDGVSLRTVSKPFTTSADTAPPVLLSTESGIAASNQIQLVFKDDSKFDEDTLLDPANYTVAANNRYKDEAYVTSVQKVSFSGGKYKLKLTLDNLDYDTSYIVTASNIADEKGNVLEKNNTLSFRTQPQAPEVYNMYQQSDRSFVIEMSAPVVIIDSDSQVSAGGTSFTMRVDSINKALVRFSSPVKIIGGKEYSFDLSKLIASNKGISAKNMSGSKTVFIGEFGEPLDSEKPYIYDAIRMDSVTVGVEYSEDMGSAGTYIIKYINDKGVVKTLNIIGCEIKNSSVRIKLSPNTPMEDEYEYFLILNNLAKDKAGNISNHKAGEEFIITD